MFSLLADKSFWIFVLCVFIVIVTFQKTDMFIKRTLIEHVIIHRQAKRLTNAVRLAMLDKQPTIIDTVNALKQYGFDVIIHRIIRESIALKLDFRYVAIQLSRVSKLQWVELPDGVRLVTKHGYHDYHNPKNQNSV
jgi:hypothetical protein